MHSLILAGLLINFMKKSRLKKRGCRHFKWDALELCQFCSRNGCETGVSLYVSGSQHTIAHDIWRAYGNGRRPRFLLLAWSVWKSVWESKVYPIRRYKFRLFCHTSYSYDEMEGGELICGEKWTLVKGAGRKNAEGGRGQRKNLISQCSYFGI